MPENVNTSALNVHVGNAEENEAEDNRPVMIKVDHVSMSFNMASEQLNSLKEYAIALARRNLFFEEFKALDDVSFEVRKGDVFGIIGTNGSGKSTMLKIIAGVLDPTKGTCQVNGNIAPLIELGAGFDMDLSARENIYLNGALLGYSHQFIDEHFDDIVEFAEVEKFLDMPMKNFSSGMVSRIAFAIATVIVPEILLVDEVLSVGDFMFQKKCEDRIKTLIDKYGVTVLIVSHSNDQIARLCNKAIWIEKGHTRLQGDASVVTRVYDGLGGRTGSPEAENVILAALKHSATAPTPDDTRLIASGETANNLSASVIRRVWQDEKIRTVSLVSDSSHANAIVAGPLAGALSSPILPTGPERLPDAVWSLLYEHQPTTILTFDCGARAQQAFAPLHELPWHPEVLQFGYNTGLLFEFSQYVFDYGLDNDLWGREIALLRFGDAAEAFLMAPYLYRNKCPVFMMPDDLDYNDAISQLLPDGRFERILALGNRVVADAERVAGKRALDSRSFTVSTKPESSIELTSFVFGACKQTESRNLYVADRSLARWPELVSVGAAAGRQGSALLLLDETNLDQAAACLEFVASNREAIRQLEFIAQSFTPIEQDLLCSALMPQS